MKATVNDELVDVKFEAAAHNVVLIFEDVRMMLNFFSISNDECNLVRCHDPIPQRSLMDSYCCLCLSCCLFDSTFLNFIDYKLNKLVNSSYAL